MDGTRPLGTMVAFISSERGLRKHGTILGLGPGCRGRGQSREMDEEQRAPVQLKPLSLRAVKPVHHGVNSHVNPRQEGMTSSFYGTGT